MEIWKEGGEWCPLEGTPKLASCISITIKFRNFSFFVRRKDQYVGLWKLKDFSRFLKEHGQLMEEE
jgi:hypothetical protein